MVLLGGIFTCLFIITFNAWGEIISVQNLTEVQKVIEDHHKKNMDEKVKGYAHQKDALVVFDIMTIINKPKNAGSSDESIKKFEPKDVVLMLTNHQPHKLIIADNAPQVIAILKKQFQVMCYISTIASKKAINKSIIILRKLGIHFTPDMTLKVNNQYKCPLIAGGILFGDGKVCKNNIFLLNFLKNLKRIPTMIVVINDNKKDLESIEKTLLEEKLNIKFIGIEYKYTTK